MKYAIAALILIVGAINAAPIIGVVSVEQLHVLYGVDVSDPNFEVLLRHRAVLLGLLGAFMMYAAFRARRQWLAIGAGLASKLVFVVLAYGLVGDVNASIANVARIDVATSGALTVAAVLKIFAARVGAQS